MCPTLPPLPARCPACRVSQGSSRSGHSSRKLRPVSTGFSLFVVVEVACLGCLGRHTLFDKPSTSRLIAIILLSFLAGCWLENITAESTHSMRSFLFFSLRVCECVPPSAPSSVPACRAAGSLASVGHSVVLFAWMDPESRLGPCLG